MIEEKEGFGSTSNQSTKANFEGASIEKPQEMVRRYDIDWLRVILFTLLIWYHYLYFYPPRMQFDDSNLILTFTLSVMHQWRLAALFVISGMGAAFAFRRRTWQAYLKERGDRLLVPLLFVVYFLNGGFLTPADTTRGLLRVFPKADVTGHLWFVYNLLVYSVILTPLFIYVRRNADGKLVRSIRALLNMRYGLGIMLVPPLILTLTGILFKPWMYGGTGRWWEFPWYFLFFAFGYLLLTDHESYFSFLDRIRISVTIITPILSILYFLSEEISQLPGLMYGGWVWQGYLPFSFTATLGTLIQAAHAWFWCLLLFSWASRLLDRPSRALAYLNQAVYPIYIVHMPLIYLFVFLLSGLTINSFFDGFILGLFLVALSSLLIFEIVKRARFARVAFGIKQVPQKNVVEIRKGSGINKAILFHVLTIIIIIVLNWGSWMYRSFSQ